MIWLAPKVTPSPKPRANAGAVGVANRPTARVPHTPFIKCTATAPTGSSTCSLWSSSQTPKTTSTPATPPITMAPRASVTSHPAVMATRPASEAFRHIETSGLPYLIQVTIMHTTVATEGATVVVRKTEPSSGTEVAAAPLKPYQPSHRINTPSAPMGRLCPGNALTLTTLPSLFFTNLPMRGPSIHAPMNAHRPPTIWMHAEPAKSWKPICASQPPPQTQCASMG